MSLMWTVIIFPKANVNVIYLLKIKPPSSYAASLLSTLIVSAIFNWLLLVVGEVKEQI